LPLGRGRPGQGRRRTAYRPRRRRGGAKIGYRCAAAAPPSWYPQRERRAPQNEAGASAPVVWSPQQPPQSEQAWTVASIDPYTHTERDIQRERETESARRAWETEPEPEPETYQTNTHAPSSGHPEAAFFSSGCGGRSPRPASRPSARRCAYPTRPSPGCSDERTERCGAEGAGSSRNGLEVRAPPVTVWRRSVYI
jgi:hypothetical protein